MTPKEEKLEQYRRIARKDDAFGRVIGVRMLKVSQQVKISEMTPALEGETEMSGDDGKVIRIPRRSIPVVVASVCEIDGQMIPFPRTRGELDSMMDLLDEEGILAAVLAYSDLKPGAKVEDGEAESMADAAKK